ncbi:hypothetical protein AB0G83_31255 [Streptomyces klenkii]|uniref:hypothetical protein n=1 Tax=Streptomyces klenkii TaxID=1420899 RepID=UPI0033C137F9
MLATMYGDAVTLDTATQWAVAGKRSNPLLFFQSVSTSILSHLTRRYGIHGPLTCISAVPDPAGDALKVADALLDDPELHQVLVIGVETKPNERVSHVSELAEAADGRGSRLPAGDAAAAILLRRIETETGGARLALSETRPGTTSGGSGEPAGPLGWLTNFMELCADANTRRHEAYTYMLSCDLRPVRPTHPSDKESPDDHS